MWLGVDVDVGVGVGVGAGAIGVVMERGPCLSCLLSRLSSLMGGRRGLVVITNRRRLVAGHAGGSSRSRATSALRLRLATRNLDDFRFLVDDGYAQ